MRKPWSVDVGRAYAAAMIVRSLSPALLALCLFASAPALAQADDSADESFGDEEWGDEGEGAVLGDDVPVPAEEEPSPQAPADVDADDAETSDPVGDAPPASPPRAAPDDAASDPAGTSQGSAAAAAPQKPSSSSTAPDEGTDDDVTDEERVAATAERRVGDPLPLTRREPLLPQLGVEVGIRYGLVGTGPTRFIDDIRFGVFDWLELRTALAPYPSSLMARVGIGRAQSPWGVLLLEGGLAHLDAGLRLVPDEGEAEVGIRAHLEATLAYQVAFLERFSFYTSAHWRSRFSMLSNDNQHAFAVDAAVTYDVLPVLAVTGGLGYAQTLFDTDVREVAINFVEIDRPGMSHFLVRDDFTNQSLTVPLALTYGRVENFDVDLFATTRVWPKLDIVFGAGVRWRWWFGRKPWEPEA